MKILNFLKDKNKKSISHAFNAEILRRQKKTKEALKYIKKAIASDKNNSNYYMISSLIKKELMDYNGALKDINKAISLNPDFNWNYIYRHLIYRDLNLINKANEELEIIEKNYNNNADSLFNFLADDELNKNNPQSAIKYLEKAVKFNNKNEKLLLKKINLERDIRDFINALEDVKLLIEIENKNAEYYHVKANIEHELKLYEDALEDANYSISLNDKNDGYYSLRARINMAKQDYNCAINDINCAIKLNCNNIYYKQLKSKLIEMQEK